MTEKTKTTSLIDYMKVGADIKLVEELLSLIHKRIYKVLDGREANGAEKTAHKVLEHIKSDAEDNMFEAYPELENNYIHAFYSSLYGPYGYEPGEYFDDVEEEIRSIALDHIAYIAINMYGVQAFDMMKERFGGKQ